jgi:hypothetical protein
LVGHASGLSGVPGFDAFVGVTLHLLAGLLACLEPLSASWSVCWPLCSLGAACRSPGCCCAVAGKAIVLPATTMIAKIDVA